MFATKPTNNRVLYFATGSTTASRVYGQGGDFSTATSNKGGISATSLNTPTGVALDSSGGLYVSDNLNNRVLYFATGSTTASRVYGQNGNFATNTIGCSATSFYKPIHVALDSSGGIYVSDRDNNRVLYFATCSTTASRVYGQGGDFTTRTFNKGGISATSFYGPLGVTLDSSGGIYVSDRDNHRVLYFATGSTTASRVYGQGGDFTTGTFNKGGISATSFYVPSGVTLDSSGGLYVSDTFTNRVLYFATGSTTASRVYGQDDVFPTGTSNKGGKSATHTSLYYPYGVALDWIVVGGFMLPTI